jgi:MarR family transcriptional regulator, organic hydroperoxide resistance regulator
MASMCAKSRTATCEAWQLLVRFSFTQRATLPALAAELELSPAQCHLLNQIDPDRPMPMKELANALSCDASNVTGLVDRLESRGLITRSPSTADRRVKVLKLTPLGAKVRAALLERMTSSPPTLGRLSEAEQRALARILRRLLE